MNKSDLIDAISLKENLTDKNASELVNLIFDGFTGTLKNGDRIEIRGFGSFNIRHKNLRQARNPRTGEKVTVQPKNVPSFKISKEFKMAVSESLKSDER